MNFNFQQIHLNELVRSVVDIGQATTYEERMYKQSWAMDVMINCFSNGVPFTIVKGAVEGKLPQSLMFEALMRCDDLCRAN